MDRPPKGCPVVSIPKDIDMWSETDDAEVRRAIASRLVNDFRKIAKEAHIPKGWVVEIHGGD